MPVQHWSRRRVFDADRLLWCGFILISDQTKAVLIGDSGYFRGFTEVGEKIGPFHIAFLPIGAYLPRRLMAPQHMSPDESIQTAIDLRAKILIPIHWGTFDLSDEPIDEPPKTLLSVVNKNPPSLDSMKNQKLEIFILKQGEPFFR